MANIQNSRVPFSEILESFSRSGGKGGQNVNKVSTKVELRWNIDSSAVFNEAEKKRIREVLKNKINKDGELVVYCQAERSQAQNRVRAFEKLNELVAKALVPIKKRRPTKPTRASKERRLETKKIVALKKVARRQVGI